MSTETDTQATYEKWLGARADDPTLPHDLIRDAFLAGVEAGRKGRVPSDEDILKMCESVGFAFHYDKYAPGSGYGLQAKAYDLENFRALLSRYSGGQSAANAEPVARATIYMHRGRRQFLLNELGTKAAGDLGAGVHDLFAAPVAAQAQPSMPALTDEMRAVLRNEHCVYDSEDALYAALCEAAGQ